MNTIDRSISRWDRVVEALILSLIEVGECWDGEVPLEVTEEGVLFFTHFDPYTRNYLLRGNWEGELPDDWQSWPITIKFELAPGKYLIRLRINIEAGSITLELLESKPVEHFEEIGNIEE